MNSITELIKDITEDIREVHLIAKDAKTCEDSKQVVVDSMDGLSAVAEENAAASEETSSAMTELDSTVHAMAESAREMEQVSRVLMEQMEFFKF